MSESHINPNPKKDLKILDDKGVKLTQNTQEWKRDLMSEGHGSNDFILLEMMQKQEENRGENCCNK